MTQLINSQLDFAVMVKCHTSVGIKLLMIHKGDKNITTVAKHIHSTEILTTV